MADENLVALCYGNATARPTLISQPTSSPCRHRIRDRFDEARKEMKQYRKQWRHDAQEVQRSGASSC
jgi:hypothetical protein